jgi:hypothetical protein
MLCLSSFTRDHEIFDLGPDQQQQDVDPNNKLLLAPSPVISVREFHTVSTKQYCDGTSGPWKGRCTVNTLAALGCFDGEWVLVRFGSQGRAVRLCAIDNGTDAGSDEAANDLVLFQDEVLYLRSEALFLIERITRDTVVSIHKQRSPSYDAEAPVPTAAMVVLERVKRVGSSGHRSYASQASALATAHSSALAGTPVPSTISPQLSFGPHHPRY